MIKLRFFRQERGLSQLELSEATKIPRYRIQLIEQGLAKPTEKELQVFAKVLGLQKYTSEGIWAFKIN